MPATRIRYVVLYWWDELFDMYVATVPDMPETRGQGPTLDEAFASVQAAMESYLQGLAEKGIPLPVPRQLLSKQIWVRPPENARFDSG